MPSMEYKQLVATFKGMLEQAHAEGSNLSDHIYLEFRWRDGKGEWRHSTFGAGTEGMLDLGN